MVFGLCHRSIIKETRKIPGPLSKIHQVSSFRGVLYRHDWYRRIHVASGRVENEGALGYLRRGKSTVSECHAVIMVGLLFRGCRCVIVSSGCTRWMQLYSK